jgi:hypothetical protein
LEAFRRAKRLTNIHRDELHESGADEFAKRLLFGSFVRDAWERKPVLISTSLPGLSGSNENMKDAGGHLALGDEVPLIVILDVGESRSRAGRARVGACGMYMFGGSTSTEVEGGNSNMEEVEGK